jgi:hypothetical protein
MASRPKRVGMVPILLMLACSSKSSTNPDAGNQLRDGLFLGGTDAAADLAAPPDLPPDSPPFLVDPGAGTISKLRIQGSTLYWIGDYRRIVKASVDGTGATTLYTASGKSDTVAIKDIAVDDSSIYFTYSGNNYTDRGVYKLALGGDGTAVRLTSTQNPNSFFPSAITVSGDDICYSESPAIRHVKTSGGTVTTMVQDRGGPNEQTLVVKQGYVYFTVGRGSAPEELYRWPVGVAAPVTADAGVADGGAVRDAGAVATPEKVSLVPGNMNLELSPCIDQGFIYWVVYHTVYRTDGTSAPAAVFTAGPDIGGMLMLPYDGSVYWSADYRVYKQTVGEAGGGTAIANIDADYIVADASYLYLSTGTSITRLAH